MYVTASQRRKIHVFNLKLNHVDTISTSSYKPSSISGFNNRLYVGCEGISKIVVIENKQIINTFNACGNSSKRLLSLIFDQSGYLATSCLSKNNYEARDPSQLYLYNKNLSFTGKTISISGPHGSYSFSFDSKGLFVVVFQREIILYY
jgi:hypothetical protein